MRSVYEWAGVRYVITKFSRMDSLPNFLTHGAPLARLARESSAIKLSKISALLFFNLDTKLIAFVRTEIEKADH